MRSSRRSVARYIAEEAASSGRSLAGVGNQRRCPNGHVDCRYGAGDTDAPCFECFVGGEDDE